MASNTETILVHEGQHFNSTAAVTAPIFQTSTYIADSDPAEYIRAATEPKHPYFYHRHGNPTNSQVAAVIAKLEKTEDALVFATGMAAISTAILAIVKSGDHIVTQLAHYSGTAIFFKEFLTDYGITVTAVDQTDTAAFADAIQVNTKLIYIETPSNPNLNITDLKAVGELAKQHNILSMVDNTFASPINQTPRDFGIDIVVHSATKYLGGHSDLTAGIVCGSQDYIAKVWKRSVALGASLAPLDSWLLLRGLKTLSLRVKQINSNALELASFLDRHPKIKNVSYPGLSSHPQHKLAARQMHGFSGMICIEVEGTDEEQAFKNGQALINNLEIFINAASLGGVESLIVHPASMWGGHHTQAQKKASGITLGMLRISVGIENVADLIEDLEQALRKLD
ncbi:trans-sulfuration enzyme family protein [Sphingobacterium sp. GVS05A]|uniref:trans-sulfuration enzyme family protein n=1 Tax=Sphingobacterium TaxID=28453 RepID=UPI001CBC9C8B|nr:aminotransferase class I/II-fold pyridoxal phosphate-dependent enzyme [Sphingobacterium sp. GVS05A]